LEAGASADEVEASRYFYEPGSLVGQLTPAQDWRDHESLHRGPRYRWHREAG
jgi:hypothetical protein